MHTTACSIKVLQIWATEQTRPISFFVTNDMPQYTVHFEKNQQGHSCFSCLKYAESYPTPRSKRKGHLWGIRYVWYIINYIKSVYNTKQLFPWTNSGVCNFVTKPLVICFEKHHYLFEWSHITSVRLQCPREFAKDINSEKVQDGFSKSRGPC